MPSRQTTTHPVVIVHRHFEVEVLLHIGVHIHGQLTEKQVEVEVPYQIRSPLHQKLHTFSCVCRQYRNVTNSPITSFCYSLGAKRAPRRACHGAVLRTGKHADCPAEGTVHLGPPAEAVDRRNAFQAHPVNACLQVAALSLSAVLPTHSNRERSISLAKALLRCSVMPSFSVKVLVPKPEVLPRYPGGMLRLLCLQ